MSASIDIVLPEAQEGTQSIVAKWFKAVGDTVAANEPIIEISTDKVMMEIAAPAAGELAEIIAPENAEVAPGTILGRIRVGAQAAAAERSVPPSESPDRCAAPRRSAPAGGGNSAALDLSPAVKRLLKEHNLTADQVRGTGKDGRITHADVLAAVAGGGAAKSGQAGGASAGPSRRVPHTPMRRMIATHMRESVATAPHVTSVFEADLEGVLAHRAAHLANFASRGVKLTLTAYFVRATARALVAVPEVNSRWHDDALEIFEDANIGVATALGDAGLIVPVIRRAQTLDLFETARALDDIVQRARTGSITSAEVQGGTFTISNHGVSGSLVATPIIINQPQSAILGIGKLERRVVALAEGAGESFVARSRCYVSLTIDHRVLDGFQANAFLAAFIEALNESAL
jgi:2-oxoglutarate dehydrogenase E2 component (dihydrolipoamide succinyltransferase)